MNADHANVPWRRWERIALIVFVVGFGLYAMSRGQSANFDLRNYHWYNGWAWLNDRHGWDLAAAQTQSWFNPLMPAGLYLLLSSLKPWAGTFLLGCLQGLNIVPLHRIALRVAPGDMLARHRWLPLVIAVVGATGAAQRGEAGTTFGDNLVSLPLLFAIALLLPVAGRCATDAWKRITAAGLLLGLAVGIKLTLAPWALGIGAALVCMGPTLPDALKRGILLAGTAAALFLVSSGAWMWQLWQEFHNPLFPLFANLFGGEFQPPADLRDRRFLPVSVIEWLAYPLAWVSSSRRVSELWFLDLRVPLWFLSLVALPLWWRRLGLSRERHALAFVLVLGAASYAGWLVLFGIYRYLVVLEMLAPVVVAAVLWTLPFSGRGRAATLAVVLLTVGVTTKPANWGHARHYGAQYVEVAVPAVPGLDRAMIVMADGEPLSFVIPQFPWTTQFVRVGGGFIGPPMPPWALDRVAAKRIASHTGPFYALFSPKNRTAAEQALAAAGIALGDGECRPVPANLYDRNAPVPVLCPAQRAAAPMP
ncbi:hypothetical protein [Tahibacter amnicola]|uniref:DUF2029 domain-containing protein n=1 Tax=Tahibacter amnicola TaxID=2976241 RepID=A0ABY6BBS5_9GAMM|nr:hypothetical protein [Tahibacter amnicola]UXI67506.1 hypothetical protein N4264_22655 [Tahibacter amnicola]